MTVAGTAYATLRSDDWSAGQVLIDFNAGTSLAIELDFEGPQPRHFGAPPASSTPYVAGTFEGDVRRGGSCNCRSITLIPHCNGTHTESAGHLTVDQVPLHRLVPVAPVAAMLLSIPTVTTQSTEEDSVPAPLPDDRLITAAALRAAWPAATTRTRALVIRTLEGSQDNPPYLSRQAAAELVARGIEHLVIDLPSIDRSHDEGRLTAHHIFFGLPPASTRLGDAARAHCTITEFAFIPAHLADGAYALQLQVPAFSGDAVPSRPILFRLLDA